MLKIKGVFMQLAALCFFLFTISVLPQMAYGAEVNPNICITPDKMVEKTPTTTNTSYEEGVFNAVNGYRASIGLPAYQKDENLCEIARSRGPELSGEIQSGAYHQGLYKRDLPYWITENMAFYPSVAQDMNFWLHSAIHKKAIESNHQYSCTHCEGNICIQLFTDWVRK